MKRVFKLTLLILTLLFIALPALSYIIYDGLEFQTRRSDIRSLIESGSEQDRQPPPQVVGMLNASERNGTSGYAASLLMRALKVIPEQHSTLGWHLRRALWQSFVRLHLSEPDRVAIILSLAPTGQDRHGFSSTANALYGRVPSELTLVETATIVALIRTPTAKDASLEDIRNMLLHRYALASNG